MTSHIDRQLPEHRVDQMTPRRHRYALVIPVINEGSRIQEQLRRVRAGRYQIDVIVADGGSTDGSLDPALLRETDVTAVLTKLGSGKLSAQLRMAYAWCLDQGYEGIVTVDGNGKDGVDAIPRFVERLDAGDDLVQGSRYLPGGEATRTPLDRALGGRLIHAPAVNLASGHHYTDTTNGYRAYSRKLLLDDRLQPFRHEFDRYSLLFYMSVRAPELHYRVTEIPVSRVYPDGATPTKIVGLTGKAALLRELIAVACGFYHPAEPACAEPVSTPQRGWKTWLLLVPLVLASWFCLVNLASNWVRPFNVFAIQIVHDSLARYAERGDLDIGGFMFAFQKEVHIAAVVDIAPNLAGRDVGYVSQFSLQYDAMKALVAAGLSADAAMLVGRLISLALLALVISCFGWAIAKEFGNLSGAAAIGTFALSPTFLWVAGHPYWAFFLDFAPFCLLWFGYPRLRQACGAPSAAIVFFLVLLKGLCGYEYLSCVASSGVVPVLYYETKRVLQEKRRWLDWSGFGRMTIIGAAGIVGGIASMGLHVAKAAQYFGTWHQGFRGLTLPFLYSTLGDSRIENTQVLKVGTIYDAGAAYFWYAAVGCIPLGGWICITGSVLLMVWLSRRCRGVRHGDGPESIKLSALTVAGVAATLCSFSWLLALSHVIRHTSVDWIAYYMPMLPMFLVIIVVYASRELAAIRILASTMRPNVSNALPKHSSS